MSCKAAAPGATFLLNSPFGPEEVWDHLPRPVAASRSSTSSCGSTSSTANQVAQRRRHGRPRQHHHADLLLRLSAACCRGKKRSTRSSMPSRRPTANAAKPSCRSNFAAVDAHWRICIEVKVPIGSPAASICGRRFPTARQSLSRDVTATDYRWARRRPAGQRAAGRRHLSQRHHAVGKAQHCAGDPGVGSSSVHPVRQVRAGLPARGHPRQGLCPSASARALRTSFKSAPATWKDFRDSSTRCRSHRKTAPAAGCAWRLAPPRTRATPSQGDQHGPPGAAARERSAELGVLPRYLPESRIASC